MENGLGENYYSNKIIISSSECLEMKWNVFDDCNWNENAKKTWKKLFISHLPL